MAKIPTTEIRGFLSRDPIPIHIRKGTRWVGSKKMANFAEGSVLFMLT